ncbi:MAG: hypothetical protein M3Y58_22430 [Chloroflexota bacterium]|nr:hypothetical protein [Chloroflexota bacterium]
MESHRRQLARFHIEIRALHTQFTAVTTQYEAGHLTLSEEVMLLRDIIHATTAVMDRVTALVSA